MYILKSCDNSSKFGTRKVVPNMGSFGVFAGDMTDLCRVAIHRVGPAPGVPATATY